MQLPDYWLPRQSFTLDAATRAAFDALLEQAIADGPTEPIAYTLDAPKWQFLCYAAEERGLALHGSGNPHIAEFEPRQPQDVTEFGAQNAVYAASDGIWPLYFALLDRERYPTSLVNGCIRITLPDGSRSEPYYLFSVGRHVIHERPWREGTIYLLPKETFIPEPPISSGPLVIHTTQLASLEPVTPLAKLTVTPDDFPFLEQMLAHDDTRLEDYAAAIRSGAPWPDEEER
jgi:hypothetical protein